VQKRFELLHLLLGSLVGSRGRVRESLVLLWRDIL
jgi:hypothetical protein